MGVGSDLLSKYTSDISFLQATSIKWDMNTIPVHPHHFENSIPGGSMSVVGTRRKMLHGSCDFKPPGAMLSQGLLSPAALKPLLLSQQVQPTQPIAVLEPSN